ncbi:hypothetical protein [Pseudomonas putida]|uniref:hypothetical protein n=1 Tax=Pseudomonas putida TaxID=303 RepID=UPI001F51B818|nr:hypothetical protein [Pseudomonas putida]MCI0913336.1 hypothetical protein [Pseudomonas putida]
MIPVDMPLMLLGYMIYVFSGLARIAPIQYLSVPNGGSRACFAMLLNWPRS